MATLYPIYNPLEPTGPLPDDFGEKDEDWLIGVVKRPCRLFNRNWSYASYYSY